MKTEKYTAVFRKEEVGYSLFFPAVEGCYTEGDSKEDAITNTKAALSLAVEALKDINPSFELQEDKIDSDYEMKEGNFVEVIDYKSL